jgi:hypothetical protein
VAKSSYAFEGIHEDDDGEPCNCGDLECLIAHGPSGNIIVCPNENCHAADKFSLVCGDHGVKCDLCGTRFTCP